MSTKWRDALKEYSKRDLPKKQVKETSVIITQSDEKAFSGSDLMLGFNNGRIDSKKRQKAGGVRYAINQVRFNGAMTADQIKWLTKQNILKYEQEVKKITDKARIKEILG